MWFPQLNRRASKVDELAYRVMLLEKQRDETAKEEFRASMLKADLKVAVAFAVALGIIAYLKHKELL